MSRHDPDDRANRKKQVRYKHSSGAPGKALLEVQDRVLVRISSGETNTAAMAAEGRELNTLEAWKTRYPDFLKRYVQADLKRRDEFNPEQVAFDADFRKRFFSHDTPAHLQQLIDVINTQVEIAAREQRRDRRVLVLMPPEHAKSTVAVEEYIAYRTSQDPTFRSSVVCSTQGQARKRLGAISRMLTDRKDYSDLVDTYGPFKSEDRSDSKPWTADYIMHVFAPASQRDYTCQAMGWTGSPYGDRMDLIVCDDIASLKNQTPATIDDQWEKLWGEFRTRIRKGGLFLVVGTHMREADIYTVMQEKGFFTDVIVLPAIVREPGTLDDDDPGEALWEEGTSMAELLAIRETDLRMFELMYQQNPLPSIGAMFPLESIESCYDKERAIGHIPDGSIVVCGIDPSVSNYTAAVVFALKPTPGGEWMRYLVDVWNEKNLTGDGNDNHMGVVEFIVEVCRAYKVTTLCVEDGAWMSLINNSFTLRSKLNTLGVSHFPIKATEETVGVEAIRQLSGLFNHRLISLPGTPNSRQRLSVMVNQFLTFTGEKSHWRKAFDIVKAFRQAEHATKMVLASNKGGVRQVAGDDVPDWLVDESSYMVEAV